MQTYLPFPDFKQCAAALDTDRLGKQRAEVLQILRTLVIPEFGRLGHPAIRMWMGHVPALTLYGLAMVDEWESRGNPDKLRADITEFAPQAAHPDYAAKIPMPHWLGESDLHLSHRSKLIQKDAKFYGEAFAGTPAGLEYIWPEPTMDLIPEDPEEDFLWVVRSDQTGTAPEKIRTVGLPAVGKPATRSEAADVETPEEGAAAPVRKEPQRPVKKPTARRKRQEEVFRTLPGKTPVLVPLEDGRTLALGKVVGRPITLDDGRFGRNFELTQVLDRSDLSNPALLQDPRIFFPVPDPAL
ncbi:MSMEG_6728 family protein [Arthrobacter celericrescens]|uniref:MSMEG_6728 family protein n=1 Tax=Arthrobacter celericrescens TaxID=2320851 RepID=UPI000EA031ED|nr:MSMEG_6728 family protein [Arthrobacter celericrescens]